MTRNGQPSPQLAEARSLLDELKAATDGADADAQTKATATAAAAHATLVLAESCAS